MFEFLTSSRIMLEFKVVYLALSKSPPKWSQQWSIVLKTGFSFVQCEQIHFNQRVLIDQFYHLPHRCMMGLKSWYFSLCFPLGAVVLHNSITLHVPLQVRMSTQFCTATFNSPKDEKRECSKLEINFVLYYRSKDGLKGFAFSALK